MTTQRRRAALTALVLILVLAAAVPAAEADPPPSPALRSPVYGTDVREAGVRNFPDPAVLRANGRWFAFSSSSTGAGAHNLAVVTSGDLWDWQAPRGDRPEADAMPDPPAWARGLGQGGSFWAPSAAQVGDQYVLWFAARHRSVAANRSGWCIGAARSANPGGPYTAVDRPVVCRSLGHGQSSSTSRSPAAGQGMIDPFVYRSPSGAQILLVKALDRPWQLQAMRLTGDGLGVQGPARGLLALDDQARTWEYSNRLHFTVMENPTMDHNPGAGNPFVLYYSGSEWQSTNYATGYATCRSPLGPCRKVTTTRAWLRSSRGVAGPGGLVVFRGDGAQKWVAYHSWAPNAIADGAGRRLHVEPLTYRNGVPSLQNRSPQGTFNARSDLPGTVTFSGRASDPDTGRPPVVLIREEGTVVARAAAVGGTYEVSIQDVELRNHRYCATVRDDHRAPHRVLPCEVVDLGLG